MTGEKSNLESRAQHDSVMVAGLQILNPTVTGFVKLRWTHICKQYFLCNIIEKIGDNIFRYFIKIHGELFNTLVPSVVLVKSKKAKKK